jgi:anaerobic selenocysteine-containing dehydrogenase
MAKSLTIKTTCPRDCYDACGISATLVDGKITRVVGDSDHPVARGVLCGKCAIAYNGAWRDDTLRLSRPLKRTGRKGDGEFTPVSWAEALDDIAGRFRALADADEGDRILHTHYTGTVGLIGGWYPIRLFNRLGATEVDPDTVCNKAGHAALELVFGTSLEGFDPRTIKDARTILVWGANPSHSAPHQDKGWLKPAQNAGVKIIAVDPIGHGTAEAADLHLKLFPGTDAALAFALLHVLRANELIDLEFVSRHVQGASDLSADIDTMTPARASELCGVPARLIEEAAMAYGRGPSLLWLGQGVQRQPHGGNVFRALSALVAMSGNLAKPGAGLLYMNGPAMRGIDMATLTEPGLAHNGVPSISHMDLAAKLEVRSGFKIFCNWNNNPAASSPEQARLRNALKRDDLFHVAIDLFHTDTTAYADYILPAASFLEFDDLVVPYFDLTLSAQVKVSDPPGEALPNQEIFRRLAAAMGYEDDRLFESDPDLIERLLAQTAFSGSFKDLAEAGTVKLFPEPRIQFANLQFSTPSGRIEISSDRAVEMGLPRSPLPHTDKRPASGRLRILSPASLWLMNSSYGNDKNIQRRLGEPKITLHPNDARDRKVADGDRIILANEGGELTLTVAISEITQPGVGIVHKGRWPNASTGDANINLLVRGRKSDIAESTTVHGTEVELKIVEMMKAAE